MAKDILVSAKDKKDAGSSAERALRMAIVSDGELLDYAVNEPGAISCVGNIYKGSVTIIYPGTQSCFVNIGHERNAILYADDIAPIAGSRARRPIETMVRAGQKIVVQVLRDASDDKGAHVTTKLAMPGKYAVLLPGAPQCAVSRRITDQREAMRLRGIAQRLMPANDGLIIRTEAAGADEDRIAADVASLVERRLRMRIREAGDALPDCIHTETDFCREILFRALEEDISRVIIDDRATYSELLNRASAHYMEMAHKINHYREPWPLFAFHGVQGDVDNLHSRKVWLKCGAYIVIDRTEAMTVIDVNTGKYNGTDRRETFLRVNVEAVLESARQLRLRDIGGIIVIDLLKMDSQADQRAVADALNSELKKDRQKTAAVGFTRLGLLEMTRKKARAAAWRTGPGYDIGEYI
ncbi:MAG: Rne/Rng family ribonuclease [Oscillospiraceae bacterium]|nr:Rne/Rng family ribonuclease [Oscillospiraceae bacterium]